MQSSSVSSWEKRENYHSPMFLGTQYPHKFPKCGVLMFFRGNRPGSSFCEPCDTELDHCWIPQCLIQLREWTMRACARVRVGGVTTFFSEKSKTEYRLEISFSHTYIAIIYIHYLWKRRQLAVRGLFPTNILLSSLIVSSHMQLLPSMKKNHHLIGANLEDGRKKKKKKSNVRLKWVKHRGP